MSRFALLQGDEDEDVGPPIATLLRQTSVLARQGVIDDTHKSALKDSILSGDDQQISSARTLLDELALSRKQVEVKRDSGESRTTSSLSNKAKPFVPQPGPPSTTSLPATATPSKQTASDSASQQPELSENVVLILRGLPGSGKSSLVKNVAQKLNTTVTPWICSADHYFTDKSGRYNFDLKLLSKAHNACMSKFLDGMLAGQRLIVVDNTSSTKWEYENYVKMAQIAGYAIQIREIRCDSEKAVRVFAARNTHNVPAQSVMAMWKRWEPDAAAILEDPWMGDGKERDHSKERSDNGKQDAKDPEADAEANSDQHPKDQVAQEETVVAKKTSRRHADQEPKDQVAPEETVVPKKPSRRKRSKKPAQAVDDAPADAAPDAEESNQ